MTFIIRNAKILIKSLIGKSARRRLRFAISTVCPNIFIFNYILSVRAFSYGNKRYPRHPSANNANINDLIFYRMISNRWSYFEQACVDKEYAKLVAKGICPDLRITTTVGVFQIEKGTTFEDFNRWIDRFVGKHMVAKPTHSSGSILFLKNGATQKERYDFFNYAKISYFHLYREAQYDCLEKKVIVEEDISGEHEPTDYKFTCARGKILFCAVCTDRFSSNAITFFSVPDFVPLDLSFGNFPIEKQALKPSTFDKMCRVAEKLSDRFDFVRVDLYDVDGEVIFGELTFSPGSGYHKFTNEDFAVNALRQVHLAKLQASMQRTGEALPRPVPKNHAVSRQADGHSTLSQI